MENKINRNMLIWFCLIIEMPIDKQEQKTIDFILIDLRSHHQCMPTPVCPGPLQYSVFSNSVILPNLLGENSVSLEFYCAFFVL